MRSEMAFIVDLAADIALNHLSHARDLLSVLQRVRQIEGNFAGVPLCPSIWADSLLPVVGLVRSRPT